MSEKIGLIKTTIRLVKKDEELVDRIMKDRLVPDTHRPVIVEILRHNVWTVKQFSDLTGLNESTIRNYCRPKYRDGDLSTELDFCYPFEDLGGSGPKFIIRNEKSEALLP
jgi:hypothetical protein